MKTKMIKLAMAVLFLSVTLPSFSQCDILIRVSPDGTMQYYMKPINLYWTKTKSLKACIVTDMENYFLVLYPNPFPEKPEGKKLREDLFLKLADGTDYEMKHYDSRYLENDTALEMSFLMPKSDIEKVMNFQITEAKIDMKGNEGIRSYVFKLQKDALREQLTCFLKEEEDRRKK
jgi:hypothetical protein